MYVLFVAADTDTGPTLFKLFFFLLLTAFSGVISTLSLAFVTTICFVFYKEFEYLRRTLALKLADGDNAGRPILDDLERFRLSHQRRCKVCLIQNNPSSLYLTLLYLILSYLSSQVDYSAIRHYWI